MSLLHRSKKQSDSIAPDAVPADVPSAEPAEPAPAVKPPTLWSSWLDDPGPRIEEHRDHGQVVIRLEMPGLDPDEDVEVTLADGILRIRAEHREESTGDAAGGYRSEVRYAAYARAVTLPPGASDDDVKASYRDGVLEVRVPVDEATAASKRIPVTRA
jgi:HSP20 family protein